MTVGVALIMLSQVFPSGPQKDPSISKLIFKPKCTYVHVEY